MGISRSSRVCAEKGCPKLTDGGTYCDLHRKERERLRSQRRRDPDAGIPNRPPPSARGYDREWRAFRDAVIAANPWCVRCLAHGRRTPATELHHIKPLAQGGARLDVGNVEPCCHSHHLQAEAEARRRANG